MRGEWLDDLLALLKAGSIARASELRCISQPAFSRRIMTIEQKLGIELIDRSCRPAKISDALRRIEPRLREMAISMDHLSIELSRLGREQKAHLNIVSQHSLATSIAPQLIRHITENLELEVTLHSANLDRCRSQLMTKQSDIAIVYSENTSYTGTDEDLEILPLNRDRFIPVSASGCSALVGKSLEHGELSIVGYPPNVFLGHIMVRDIYPKLRAGVSVTKRAETELTLAALQLVLAGVGIAWIPHSLAVPEIAAGRIELIDHILPSCEFLVVAQRRAGNCSPVLNRVWNDLLSPAHASPMRL